MKSIILSQGASWSQPGILYLNHEMMKRYSLFLLICIACSAIYGQDNREDTAMKVVQLEEVVFSANKFEERKKNIAQKIDVINTRQIAAINVQNTGDLLMNTGNVFIQKSQQGGSSPVIRGFEASRVLLVIDGIRMNNAIYRAGHLQNVITVDQNMLERVEILYGPASTIYGSDALGGVVHLRTKTPKFSSSDKINFLGNAFTRYSTANNEKTGHIDVNIGFKKIAFLTSVTYSDFGNLRMGNHYRSAFPDFGRRSFYIDRINNIDSIVRNADDHIQKFSGYRQWDIMQKVLFKPNERFSHALSVQFSNSGNIPRYDRLQDIRNGTLRYAEWFYGPQKRNLFAYEFQGSGLKMFFNQVKVGINLQDITESRHQREYRSNNLDNRIENIKVMGFNIDGRKIWKMHELNIGVDGQLNNLQSMANRLDIMTGTRSKIDSRYPDGKNNMNYVGIYAQHLYKIIQDKLILNDGIRIQGVNLHSTIKDTAIQLNLPYNEIRQNNLAVTGNVGLVYLPARYTKISLLLASGFRNPNIDDLSKIFESSTSLRQIIVPNPDIKPEYTYNIDLSISHTFDEKATLGLTGFYTIFRNAIITAPFSLNGRDSIMYNGIMSAVLANQNKNRAFLYGFSANAAVDFNNSLSLTGTLNYTYGRYKTDPAELSNVYTQLPDGTHQKTFAYVDEKPLDHIPPIFGKASIDYHRKNWNSELFVLFNGWKHITEYSADGEDNAQYATAAGMPAWYTINIRGHYDLNAHISLQASIENIMDRNYRHFASGLSASGRNIVVTLRASL